MDELEKTCLQVNMHSNRTRNSMTGEDKQNQNTEPEARRQWQLSTAETGTDWRSDHPLVLDVPSAAIFSLRRARAAQVGHVRRR